MIAASRRRTSWSSGVSSGQIEPLRKSLDALAVSPGRAVICTTARPEPSLVRLGSSTRCATRRATRRRFPGHASPRRKRQPTPFVPTSPEVPARGGRSSTSSVARCRYCGSGPPLQQDHRTALAAGGQNRVANVVPACPACNRAKSVSSERDYLAAMRELWGRRVPRTPAHLEERLRAIEERYHAVESRHETLRRELRIESLPWPSRTVPRHVEVAISGKNWLAVAGVSHYANSLRGLSDRRLHAALVPQPDNRHDGNAVAVYLAGRHIGHVPADVAGSGLSSTLLTRLHHGQAVAARCTTFRTRFDTVSARIALRMPLKTRPA